MRMAARGSSPVIEDSSLPLEAEARNVGAPPEVEEQRATIILTPFWRASSSSGGNNLITGVVLFHELSSTSKKYHEF